ncbi:MAG: tRNA uridine-5-carboxymethylaminomethyl(34) synthesis enzyme MnmG, partial [Candidatus Marinimicrobia bacterium]|nr:tRNA uridine-5-carboxymethylaminomethyl(34) synthesis enzyme MnmG [Candidatus Neomarinimicrobiota bacterium]
MNKFDIIVVGGGHAGIEAALMADHKNKSVALVTLDTRAVGRASCNPAIGGLAKGQIVREIDVLGGYMGLAADAAGIQFKILNRSKGRSVWSPRAQIDKRVYESLIRERLKKTNIKLLEGEVTDIIEKNGKIAGCIIDNTVSISATTVILTCGTFLNGLIHIGDRKIRAGRMGESAAHGITEALTARGLKAGRLKTGTPPRIIKSSIDFTKTTTVLGDDKPTPFSYRTQLFSPPNLPCHTVRTNPVCHDLIKDNISSAPLFSGDINGVGPRYCPSIEDKIFRFAHHDAHTLFLEPEWKNSEQIYVNGFSTSLPEAVQLSALREVSGLENAEFFRPGYAIEYDFFLPAQLKASLESKYIGGLFLAGQINGTSGYEEAGAQGLLAAVNAAQYLDDAPPLTIGRSQAYVGVLIDDLITKNTLEPYRMFTSRAEYRLLLRYSNADRRLIDISHEYNLIDNRTYDFIQTKLEATDQILADLEKPVQPAQINSLLSSLGEPEITEPTRATQIIKRPKISISMLPSSLFKSVKLPDFTPGIVDEIKTEAETMVKYAGYIRRQLQQIEKMKRQELHRIPLDFEYQQIKALSNEGREKLDLIKPETFGQAMRISGVSPADVAVLSIFL